MTDSSSSESCNPNREDPVADAATSSHARRPKETVSGFSSAIALDEQPREGSRHVHNAIATIVNKILSVVVRKNVADDAEQPDAHEGSKIDKPLDNVRGEEVRVTHDVSDKPKADTRSPTRKVDVATSPTPKVTESSLKRKGHGPAKSWSKEVPKKMKTKTVVLESDSDVPCDVTTSLSKKKPITSKLAASVPEVPIDNVSFHFASSVNRWKYVYHKRLALERDLAQNSLECKEIVDLIQEAGLLKTVTQLPKCYETLVKEFIVNVSKECADGKSSEFKKHVPDIAMTIGETSSVGNQPDKAAVIAILRETCKELEARKLTSEKLIIQLEMSDDGVLGEATEATEGAARQSAEGEEEASSDDGTDDEADSKSDE
ncbi:uncharacterized protein LOC127123834 [Lathyrus oleraceus]|uniref:uncharacterized protein LOC127123834 n=1 Tax=Pisum sativum TaxID=3888 RepID=UPI0021CFE920|nr:uncharacterized protein LOC127123834 [Pisum sativum]